MTIIDSLKKETSLESSAYLKELKAAGFPTPTPGYARITPAAISEYLLVAAEDIPHSPTIFAHVPTYCYTHEKKSGEIEITYQYGLTDLSRNTLSWVERPLSESQVLPPKHVLQSIKRAKKDFDRIVIVTVEQVVDPLVVGRNDGDDTRYLIDWWDEDIDITKIKTE